jgi:hypothetical protein
MVGVVFEGERDHLFEEFGFVFAAAGDIFGQVTMALFFHVD